MKTEEETIDICRFATIYECITSILKDNLTIEEMEKMLKSLNNYVAAEKQWMKRN